MDHPRLDILLYAHDGRGLGHASRTIAIGMALRRLAPSLRVLFVSGCKVSRELIGPAPLDWLKLPSYETEVVGGASRGSVGNSMYTDYELGELRACQLAQLVSLYRPRLVLADHTPQGKHRELVPSLTGIADTRWVLGVRGVVGGVAQVGSDLAARLFKDHYRGLLWYGDPRVLGNEHLAILEKRFGRQPHPCGYVSRLRELGNWQDDGMVAGGPLAGTISVPWLGEHTPAFLKQLALALARLGPDSGDWQLFIDPGTDPQDNQWVKTLFAAIPHCRQKPFSGTDYVESLTRSRCALIYGGYNSVMDVLARSLPAVVVLRAMRDREQQEHLGRLADAAGNMLNSVEEEAAGAEELAALLQAALGMPGRSLPIDLSGAERAASLLQKMLPGGE